MLELTDKQLRDFTIKTNRYYIDLINLEKGISFFQELDPLKETLEEMITNELNDLGYSEFKKDDRLIPNESWMLFLHDYVLDEPDNNEFDKEVMELSTNVKRVVSKLRERTTWADRRLNGTKHFVQIARRYKREMLGLLVDMDAGDVHVGSRAGCKRFTSEMLIRDYFDGNHSDKIYHKNKLTESYLTAVSLMANKRLS